MLPFVSAPRGCFYFVYPIPYFGLIVLVLYVFGGVMGLVAGCVHVPIWQDGCRARQVSVHLSIPIRELVWCCVMASVHGRVGSLFGSP